MGRPVGKKELCEHLGWSRPKLDRVLARDPNFPVVSRGDQSGGWQFSTEAADEYLRGGGIKAATDAPPIDKAQLRDTVRPPLPEHRSRRRSADHAGEATARQRKDAADASLKEDKLALGRGELVEAREMRQAVSTLVGALATDLDSLADRIVKVAALPLDAAPDIRSIIDDLRVEMVKRAEPLLAEPEQ